MNPTYLFWANDHVFHYTDSEWHERRRRMSRGVTPDPAKRAAAKAARRARKNNR